MKITIDENRTKFEHTLVSMPVGSLAVDRSGRLWFRTGMTATCLTEFGATFPSISDLHDPPAVRILPRGSTVTLTVE